jgi:hypothetical protein
LGHRHLGKNAPIGERRDLEAQQMLRGEYSTFENKTKIMLRNGNGLIRGIPFDHSTISDVSE